MFLWVYVSVCVCVPMCAYVYTCMCVVSLSIFTCVWCVYICICVYMYVCTHLCLCACNCMSVKVRSHPSVLISTFYVVYQMVFLLLGPVYVRITSTLTSENPCFSNHHCRRAMIIDVYLWSVLKHRTSKSSVWVLTYDVARLAK